MEKERLESMKRQYENIPIPGELNARVTASIAKAKKELDAAPASPVPQKTSRAFPRILARTAGVAAAAMLILTVMANSNAAVAHAMEEIPLLGSIVKVVTFREYAHSQNDMEAQIKIPEVSIEAENGTPLEEPAKELNRQIEEYTNQIIAAYEADVEAADGEGQESLTLDYKVVTDNDRLFTLRFDEEILMAGSMCSVKIYNLDKTTGSLIALKDLFTDGSDYITVISDNIKEQMHEQMQADDSISYFYESDMPELNFTEISEDENFFISEEGTLTLVFDKYEVAPGYMGVVEFEIPTDVIRGMIKDGFVK